MANKNNNYHLKQTWDEIYKSNTCEKRQWIVSSKQAYQNLREYLPLEKQITILELGCGSSNLSEIIYKSGYQNITCIDFSKQIIKSRTNKNKQINFVCADFRSPFKFAAQSQYDIIIDKGSLDCLFCQEDYLPKVLKCLLECYSKLKQGGRLISYSLSIPKNRRYWFRNRLIQFSVQVKKCKNSQREQIRKNTVNYNKTQNNQTFYMYICTKASNLSQENMAAHQQGNMNNVDFDEQYDGNDQKSNQKSEQKQGSRNNEQRENQQQIENQQKQQEENQQENQQQHQNDQEQNYENDEDHQN